MYLEVATYPEWLPEPLEPVVSRLARVDDCIGEMEDISGQWSTCAIELKQLRRSDMRFRTVVSKVRPIPPVISLLFSEAINHLRAVLDNTVWHLATEQMDSVSEKAARAINMPIYKDSQKFSEWARKTRTHAPELGKETKSTYQRVKALQPFTDTFRIPSISPTLSALIDVEAEKVHPLLLLQSYSNLDKHREIAIMVGRVKTTLGGLSFQEQDPSFREMIEGTTVAPDGNWGTPVSIDSQAAVMVERPAPWTAAVSPTTEIKRLRDWVREEALPFLVTGSNEVENALPVTIEIGNDGRTLSERITTPNRTSAQERMGTITLQRYVEAETQPPHYPIVVDEEFDD